MIASAKPSQPQDLLAWHQTFMAMAPAIVTYARIAFRKLRADAREDMVQETLANAFVAFERLVRMGKGDLAFASVLARYGVIQARCGRRVGSSLNSNDIASSYAQFRKGVVVERLDEQDGRNGTWREIVLEDQRASPADVAAIRIDFETWLKRLPGKQRRAAKLLATGEGTFIAAKRLRLSPGRISQLRRELRSSWDQFQEQANRLVA